MPTATNRHLGHTGEPYPDAYYVRLAEDRFVSTLHAQGAWQPGEQHMAPASGLVLAEAERRLPSSKLVSRVSFDILGVIHSGEFTIDVQVLRPGRSIELLEARMRHGDQTSISARIWRLAANDTTRIAGDERARLPAPDSMPPLALSSIWGGGYVASIETRRNADARPGHSLAWVRSALPLVAGEADPPVAGFLKLIDTANGIAVRERPGSVFFANVDLTVHFFRAPEAGWVGFDTRVSFGPSGLGETLSALSDARGPVGTAVQSLTVRSGEDHPGHSRSGAATG
ncbi:MAG TPA: thioesterase family protein [Castellaniella sp.]|uniref:thioesterase family protein n=1 Tax=Castellaniella sp. TaxID=1955812 RepID=UPI002EE68CAA